MLDRQAIMEKAYLAGHFFDHAPDLSLADVRKLGLDHPLARKAWDSWRASDANFDLLLLTEHERHEMNDDHWGPATRKLANLKRCPVPDKPIPKDADFSDLGDPDMRKMYESFRDNATTGSGSWPVGCVPGYENEHAIRINLDTSNAAQHWKQDLDSVTKSVARGYAEVGLRVIYILDGEPLEAEIEKKFERIFGGVIGWNELPRRGFCGQTISGRLDNDYRASTHMRGVLEFHETGHGVGLGHTRGGVMNPSILNVPISWKGDPQEETLRGYFGGDPITPEVPDDDDDDGDKHSVVLIIDGVRYKCIREIDNNDDDVIRV